MKIKVCGMKYEENIKTIGTIEPDYMGFIFYEKSPRYVEEETLASLSQYKGETIGVFVNKEIEEVVSIVEQFHLNYAQLHGDESVDYVRNLNQKKIRIIKAFQIKEGFEWEALEEYAPYVDYFLFDTATKHYGGSGLKFNWEQLKKYQEQVPFFLSGGITVDDIDQIKKLNFPQLYGIDVNSKFEIEPGLKDEVLVKRMINNIRNGK